MGVTIYHNPRCSKSRQTLSLLQAQGIEPKIIEYLKQPPTPGELEQILRLLGLEPLDLMRKNEAPFESLGLADAATGRETLIHAMCTHPILIQRPIVVANGKAAVGRPPEQVLEIL